jgi:dimethylamine monooxygenase subunit A
VTGKPSDFSHTPYLGTYKPFSIGMNLLNLDDWIEADARLPDYLAEKARLLAESRETVFREEAGTRAAQQEVLDLLAAHLPAHFPEIFRRDGRLIEVVPAGVKVDVEDEAEAPFLRAARLIQEDLVLMRKGEGGYRLAAAAVCFPSSWALKDKFGRTLDAIHTPVPGYADLMAGRVARIFDNLPADKPAWRMNWTLHPDNALHQPVGRLWPEGELAPFVRLERQTLRRLPLSGDILFTIRTYLDPVAALRDHPEGGRLAAGIKREILGLSDSQAAYRSLLKDRGRIVALLEAMER